MSISILPKVQAYLAQYGMSICLFLAVIGNILIILIFKKNHYNTCSQYLSNVAFFNTIFLGINVPFFIYAYSYEDPTTKSIVLCKLRAFGLHVIGQLGRYFTVLACIDRFAITSRHVRLRVLSQSNIARNLMIITGIILFVCAIHIVIFTTINDERCGQFGSYYNVYIAYIILFVATLPPLTMTIFTCLAFRNIVLIRAQVQSAASNLGQMYKLYRFNGRDRDLLKMVLAEVFIYVLTMSGYPIILIEIAISNSIGFKKTVNYQTIENFLVYLFTFIGYFNNAAPFYIYLIASKSFRQHVLKVLKLKNNRTIPSGQR